MRLFPFQFTLGFAALIATLTTASAQLGVGSTSDDVEFAIFNGGSLSNDELTGFGDQITVFYYYTPW